MQVKLLLVARDHTPLGFGGPSCGHVLISIASVSGSPTCEFTLRGLSEWVQPATRLFGNSMPSQFRNPSSL